MSWYATKKASKLPAMDKSKILVFDVETTGLDFNTDEIIQITILDGCGSTMFSSNIKPLRHRVWINAKKINGIKYSDVKDAPKFKSVKKEIQKLFNNAELVVGYNVGFDINFVEAAGVVVTGKIFDVMTAFRSYRSGIEKRPYLPCRLKTCAEYFGYSYRPHDSGEDARATLYCFDSMINDERFTTYKRKENQKLIEETPLEKRKTGFSISLPSLFNNRFLIGLLFVGLGLFFLYRVSGITPVGIETVKKIYLFAKDNMFLNWRITVSFVFVVLGIMMILILLIRKLLLFPKWIVISIQKLIKRIM